MSPGPPFPKLPPVPPSPIKPLREIIRRSRQQVEKARDDIRSIADELKSTATGEESEEPPTSETKGEGEEESCPVCSDLTDLKEFLGKRKVERALTQLEIGEGNKKENLQTVRKYIGGEDIG